jgi:hypothetical protein
MVLLRSFDSIVVVVEGIFRKSGKQAEVDELRKAFDRGTVHIFVIFRTFIWSQVSTVRSLSDPHAHAYDLMCSACRSLSLSLSLSLGLCVCLARSLCLTRR